MESVLKARTSATIALLTRRLCKSFVSPPLARRLTYGLSPHPLTTTIRLRRRLQCVARNHASSFSSGGGNGGESGGSGGDDGGGGSDGGGDAKSKVVASGGDEVSAVPNDVIILDVGGMTCGGCAASVKRILENQPNVASASVNLTTEVAIVWPVSEAKLTPNWQVQLGETLAKHLTNCGFNSSIRGQGASRGDIS